MNKILRSLFVMMIFTRSVWSQDKIAIAKPFSTKTSSVVQIQSGLSLLNQHQNEKSIQQSVNFQNLIYQKLNNFIQTTGGKIQYTVTEKKAGIRLIGEVRELTINFKSLIQRQGNDPSNTVVAKIYIPLNYYRHCDYKFPTSIFLHHILNEVELIEKASQLMSAGLLNSHAIFAVIHMPYYGERTSPTKQFLSADLEEFKLNLAQLTLDTHLLKNILESLPEVDNNRITLSGISLGAILGMTVGGIDQSFSGGYSFVVGGGDISSILLNRAKNRPDSEVAIALKGITLSDSEVRQTLAAVDGYTWLHRYKNQKIQLINASQDDIVDYQQSVAPLVEKLKFNNTVFHKVNNDTHSPSGSALEKYKNVFKPIVQFVIGDAVSFRESCQPVENSNWNL